MSSAPKSKETRNEIHDMMNTKNSGKNLIAIFGKNLIAIFGNCMIKNNYISGRFRGVAKGASAPFLKS